MYCLHANANYISLRIIAPSYILMAHYKYLLIYLFQWYLVLIKVDCEGRPSILDFYFLSDMPCINSHGLLDENDNNNINNNNNSITSKILNKILNCNDQ